MRLREKLKVYGICAGFSLLFIIVFALMFAMLAACVIGVPSGVMIAVSGTAMLLFKADFILTQLSPEIMMFGGLCGAFLTAALGLFAVKLGFIISRLFKKIRRRCYSLMGWE